MAKQWLMKRIAPLGRLAMAGLLIAIVAALPGCGNGGDSTDPPRDSDPNSAEKVQTQAVEIKGQTFKLELALDSDAHEQGLSDRKEIADDGGMLFVFSSPKYAGFVMRRCYVPIDLIYLDKKGYIDSTHRMEVIQPIGGPRWKQPHFSDGYPSVGRIQYVIELKDGTLDTLDLERGQKIELPFDALQSQAQ